MDIFLLIHMLCHQICINCSVYIKNVVLVSSVDTKLPASTAYLCYVCREWRGINFLFTRAFQILRLTFQYDASYFASFFANHLHMPYFWRGRWWRNLASGFCLHCYTSWSLCTATDQWGGVGLAAFVCWPRLILPVAGVARPSVLLINNQ